MIITFLEISTGKICRVHLVRGIFNVEGCLPEGWSLEILRNACIVQLSKDGDSLHMVKRHIEPAETALYIEALETIISEGWVIKGVEGLVAEELEKWQHKWGSQAGG